MFLFTQLKSMQVKLKVFTRVNFRGFYVLKRKGIFIIWSKSNIRKYLLSDMGCLSVFNAILFCVYTHTYICVYLLYANAFKY